MDSLRTVRPGNKDIVSSSNPPHVSSPRELTPGQRVSLVIRERLAHLSATGTSTAGPPPPPIPPIICISWSILDMLARGSLFLVSFPWVRFGLRIRGLCGNVACMWGSWCCNVEQGGGYVYRKGRVGGRNTRKREPSRGDEVSKERGDA